MGVYTETSDGSHFATVSGVNAVGQVIGYQGRNDVNSADSGVLGQETWLSTPTGTNTSAGVFLGLFGPNDTYTASTNSSFGTVGSYSTQQASYISTTGYVAGTTQRVQGDTATSRSTGLGSSAWVFNPSSPNSNSGTTLEIGLIGDGNSYSATFDTTGGGTQTRTFYNNQVAAVNATGAVAGFANEYTGQGTDFVPLSGNGVDAWVYAGGNTARVGGFAFTASSISTFSTSTVTATNNGTTYTQTIPAPSITPASGSFAPNSFAYGYIPRFNSLGTTYATQVARNSGIQAINSSGQVGVMSNFYVRNNPNATGQDAFVYTSSTRTYRQVGLTTDSLPANVDSNSTTSFVAYTGQRYSTINYLNASGQSAGQSSVYLGTGDSFGSGQAT